MSATDELRRLLDERGVKWTAPNSILRDTMTCWTAGGFYYEAFEVPDGTFLLTAAHQDDLTPEQAVEATLGRGECKNLIAHIQGQMPRLHCEECGCTTTLNVPSSGAGYIGETAMDWPLYCANCGKKVRA